MDQETAERIANALERIADKLDSLFWAGEPLDAIAQELRSIKDNMK